MNKSTLTVSERAFESFLKMNQLKFERIETGAEPTPDYIVELGSQKVVFELKEIASNEDNTFRHLKVHSKTIGQKARDAIRGASKQLRWADKRSLPAVLLVMDASFPSMGFHLEDNDFRDAMYGELTLTLGLSSKKILDQFNGQNETLTNGTRTHISALARILVRKVHHEITIFPNIFASTPLHLEKLPNCLAVRQFEIEGQQ